MGTVNSIAQIYIDKIKADCEIRRPLVAINCITYNHERFLRDTLEGFVNQQTDFPYVAIVHEDKSTDGTAAILREYAEKYPDIIKPIFEEENQYSKPDGSLGDIMSAAINATGAKYVAYCEGDDYWTSPNKLQKQVEIMEANPNCTMCVHKFKWINIDNTEEDTERGSNHKGEIIPYYLNLESGAHCATLTFIIKHDILKSQYYKHITNIRKMAFGDVMIVLAAYHYGTIYNIPEVMACYRRNNGGACQKFLNNPWQLTRTTIALANRADALYKETVKKEMVSTHFMNWRIFPYNLMLAGRIFWFNPKGVLKNHLFCIKRLLKKV